MIIYKLSVVEIIALKSIRRYLMEIFIYRFCIISNIRFSILQKGRILFSFLVKK